MHLATQTASDDLWNVFERRAPQIRVGVAEDFEMRSPADIEEELHDLVVCLVNTYRRAVKRIANIAGKEIVRPNSGLVSIDPLLNCTIRRVRAQLSRAAFNRYLARLCFAGWTASQRLGAGRAIENQPSRRDRSSLRI